MPDAGLGVLSRARTSGARQSGFEFQFRWVPAVSKYLKLLCLSSLVCEMGMTVLISEGSAKKCMGWRRHTREILRVRFWTTTIKQVG